MLMKKLIFIGGAMCTGKTTVAKVLIDKLEKSIMLDGDWCWYQGKHWNFSKRNKEMVVDNICCVLNNFLKNEKFEYVIFSWVLHLQETHDLILKELNFKDFKFYNISLIADGNTIRSRIKSANSGISAAEFEQFVNESLDRDNHCRKLNTVKIGTFKLSKAEVLNMVLNIIRK
jgi:predicted kinase